MHQETPPTIELPLIGVVPLFVIAVLGVYWNVTFHLTKWKPRWYRASELKKEFPELFDEKRDRIESLIYDDRSQLYAAKYVHEIGVDEDPGSYTCILSDRSQLFVAEDITEEGERWCVLTPVTLGKWKICNIWWLSLSGLCVTVPVCTLLLIVHIPLSMSSNIAGSAAVI